MISLFWSKLFKGFHYASEGIVYAIASQRNMKIHVLAALFITFLGMALHLKGVDAILLLLAIGLVIAAEIMNTAIEAAIDLVTKEHHPLAKIAKDTAAGAVLFLVFTAVLTGSIILLPYIRRFLEGSYIIPSVDPLSFFSLQGFFLLIITYAMKAFWSQRNVKLQPHVLMGIILYVLPIFSSVPILFMVMLLITFISIFLLFRKGVHWIALFQSGMISIGGFFLLQGFFFT